MNVKATDNLYHLLDVSMELVPWCEGKRSSHEDTSIMMVRSKNGWKCPLCGSVQSIQDAVSPVRRSGSPAGNGARSAQTKAQSVGSDRLSVLSSEQRIGNVPVQGNRRFDS